MRSLTSEGKRLYDKAMKLLATEVAVVQGSDRETVEIEFSRVLNENNDSVTSLASTRLGSSDFPLLCRNYVACCVGNRLGANRSDNRDQALEGECQS